MIYTVTLNPSIDYIVHVEKFIEGSLNRSTKDYINVGGKGIMVSKLLRNVGVDNVALGFLGGFTGAYIKDWFKENDFKEDFVELEENTRINVIFYGNGGNIVSMDGGGTILYDMADENGKVSKPMPDPERNGYTFIGWYTEDGKAFDFNTRITSDIKLIAKWQKK